MTMRAIVVGFLLGIGISLFAHFNDNVINQTLFIGSHFPAVLFGFLVIFAFAINPLLDLLNRAARFSAKEIAMVIAVGLVACGWPGGGFFYFFSGVVSMPGQHYLTRTNFQAAHVLSYVPGGSKLLAEGYIDDWDDFGARLAAGGEEGASGPERRVWELLSPMGRRILTETRNTGSFPAHEKSRFVNELNKVMTREDLYRKDAFGGIDPPSRGRQLLDRLSRGDLEQHEVEEMNRILMVGAFPNHILPAPKGEGVLLERGDASANAMVPLIQGQRDKDRLVGLDVVPWSAWWPVIRFWGSLALLFGFACFCLALIVQPQWKREMLPYPIVQFVHEATAQTPDGRFPVMVREKLFWYGFVIMIVIHTVNGLHKWYPSDFFMSIPLSFDFRGLVTLAPEYLSTFVSDTVLTPTFFPTVIAFTFFLSTDVSFSAGISGFLYAAIFVIATGYGIEWKNSAMDPNIDTMLRFGGGLGAAMIIFLLGRRYYANVFGAAIGMKRLDETPSSAVWAARIMVICCVGMVWVLMQNQVDWHFAVLFTLLFLVFALILTRINAETGLFLVVLRWMPISMLVMIFGDKSVGPVNYAVLAIISFFFAWTSQEMIMPFIANALNMTTRREEPAAGNRPVFSLAVMVALGFAVALVATLYVQNIHGLNMNHGSPTKWIPIGWFRGIVSMSSELSAYNELTESVGFTSMQRLMAMRPDWNLLVWAGIGFALVAGSTFMRTRFAWWPFHPVLFLIWGTWYPCRKLSASLLAGWFLKSLVVRFAGAKGYHSVKPLVIGVIAGEVMAAFGWMVVGLIYFWVTGKAPTSYSVMIVSG